ALPETLLESELFGHKAGSFTGAIRDRIGLFEEANKGTIFLDEIGDISQTMQVKLLRVLQEKEILRVGESRTRKIDVRVIAATNQKLAQLMHEGKFREDLYYRLGVIEIEIPPLRDRKEDILPLARYFVTQLTKKLNIPQLRLDATCVDYLHRYHWPGNVRELENAIERAAVLGKDQLILPEYLPPAIIHAGRSPIRDADPLTYTLAQLEHDHIQTVLELTAGNRTRAAEVLAISPATLWRKLKRENKDIS
ncbi:MAG: sigma 54-interacting transcriptional regulator, partial [bacterium]